MNVLARIFLSVFSLGWVATAGGLVALAWNEDEMLDIEVEAFNLQALIDSDDTERIIFTAIMAGVILLGLVGFALALWPHRAARRGMLRLKQADGGVVEVASTALDTLVVDTLEMLPDVHRARATVGLKSGSVVTEADLVISHGASIASVTSTAADRVSEVFRDKVGVTAVRRPVIRINYEDAAAAPPSRRAESTELPPPPPEPEPEPEEPSAELDD